MKPNWPCSHGLICCYYVTSGKIKKKMDGVRRWEMSNLVICNRFFNFSNYVKVNFLLISKIQHTFWPSKLHFRRNDTAQFFFSLSISSRNLTRSAKEIIYWRNPWWNIPLHKKLTFSIKDFFIKRYQIRSSKSLLENVIFCAMFHFFVQCFIFLCSVICIDALTKGLKKKYLHAL